MTDLQAKSKSLPIVKGWNTLRYQRYQSYDWTSESYRKELLDDGCGRLCWFIGGPLDGQRQGVERRQLPGERLISRLTDPDTSYDPGAQIAESRTFTYTAKEVIVYGRRITVFTSSDVHERSILPRLLQIIELRVAEFERATRNASPVYILRDEVDNWRPQARSGLRTASEVLAERGENWVSIVQMRADEEQRLRYLEHLNRLQ